MDESSTIDVPDPDKLPILRTFWPKRWGEVDRFRQFYTTTYRFPRRAEVRLRGVTGNFEKALTLFRVARELRTKLQLDIEELERDGFTAGHHHRDLAAVLEAVMTSLYSSLDCTRGVIGAVYPNVRGMPDSTRKFFARAREGRIGPEMPQAIVSAVGAATWYDELLSIRDELTHSQVGHCHGDRDGKVTYFHDGLGKDGRSLVIEDVFEKIQSFIDSSNALMGVVFHALNETIRDEEVQVLCGIFRGSPYMRSIRPSEAVDEHGGRCLSHTWFDAAHAKRCPFADSCGAYQRRDRMQSSELT